MIGDVQSRLFIRMQKIARFRAASLPDKRIAQLCRLSPMGLARIVALPEYRRLEKEVLTQTTLLMDEALAGNAEELRAHFATGVPMAMRAILDTIRQERDLKTRLEAAKEILDRDPDRTFVHAADANLTFNGGNGNGHPVVTIPAAIFRDAVSAGASIQQSQQDARSAAETIVPKALETSSLEDEESDSSLVGMNA